MTKKEHPRLGQLEPRYRFLLNPYKDQRFSTCPQCDRQMKVRKHPFFIHVNPQQPVLLNMSGRYCPRCDILILHQDKVEELLAAALSLHAPDVIGNNYLIIGTVERKGWRESIKQPLDYQQTFDNLHDFKEILSIKVRA